MSRKPTVRVVVGLCLAGMTGAVQAASLAGRVTDFGGTHPFAGAELRLMEIDRVTVSERDGRYRFADLPPGRYTLTAEYTGAEPLRVEVLIVDADAAVSEDLRLGGQSVRLANVLVVGQAAGQAAAISQQRAADNIKNVVSADAIGQFPDQNAAEALARVPGLSVARDQGEGRFVIIRGIDPALTGTTINGLRVPGPEKDSRQVNLDVVASDLLQSLEISKSQTPDMDGDAVGGTVEIKSATALDRGNSLTARVEGSYNQQVEKTSPKFSITGTRLLDVAGGQRNFGVAGSLSYFKRDFGSDNVETSGWPELEGPDGDFPGLEEAEQRDYTITRERLSAALNFDYRPNANLDLYWRSLYSDFSDDEVQLTNTFKFEEGDIESLDARRGEFSGAEVEKLTAFRKETQTIVATVLGAEQRLDRYTLSGRVGYSQSGEDTPDALEAVFVGEDLDLAYDARDAKRPRLSSSSAAYFDGSTYELDELVLESSDTEEQETTLALDLKRELYFGEAPGHFKFGLKARLREKDNNVDASVFEGFPEDVSLADLGNQAVDYPFGPWGPVASRGAVSDYFRANRAALELDEEGSLADSQLEDYRLSEDILAAYGLVSARFGATNLLGGLRLEQADYSARGTQLLLDEESGSGDLEVSRLDGGRKDSHLLPSFNLRHEITPRTLMRLAYSRSLARPGFEAAAPRQNIEIAEDDGEFERVAEVGNPDLKPLVSDNADIAFEYYPGGIGLISVGVFYKRIEDFFVLSDIAGQPGPYQDFDEAITTLNGDTATLYGIEFSYSRKLRFLPSPFDGVLVGANLTFSDSEAKLPGRALEVSLPRQSDRIGNLMLGYDKYGLNLRLSATYRSAYFDEMGELDDPSTDRYVDSHLQIDFTGGYRFGEHYEIYFNAINLNDEPFYAYFQSDRYNSQYEEYGLTFELGAKLSF